MKKNRPIVLILLLCAFVLPLKAQYTQLAYNFNINNSGIPSNSIYNIASDKQGNIWLATDKGLAKYDGNSFKTFDIDNGFPNNDVVNLFYQPEANTIWALTYNSQIAKVNTLTNHYLNLKPNSEVLGAFLYAYNKKDTLNFLTVSQSFSYIKNKFTSKRVSLNNLKAYLSNSPPLSGLDTRLFNEVNFHQIQKKHKSLSFNILSSNTRFGNYNTILLGTEAYIQKNGHVYRLLDLKNSIKDPTAFIINLVVRGNDIYVAINGKDGGIYYAKNYLANPQKSVFTRISKSSKTASICLDVVGNIWYALNDGLYVIVQPQLNLQYLPFDEQNPLLNLKKKNYDLVFEKGIDFNKPFTKKNDKSNTIYLSISDSKKPAINLVSKLKDISHDGKVLFYTEVVVIQSGAMLEAFGINTSYERYVAIRKGDHFENNILLSSSNDSLYVIDKVSKKVSNKYHKHEFGTIYDIFYLSNEYILLCTQKGVFITTIDFNKVRLISNKKYKKALIENDIIYFINDSEFAYAPRNKENNLTTFFHKKQFLSGLSILDISTDKNKILLHTDIGHVIFDKSDLGKQALPMVFSLSSLSLENTTIYPINQRVEIDNLSSKQIKFNSLFLNPENNLFQKSYSFTKNNVEDNWINFIGNDFTQTNIAPGNYTLKIKAKLAEIGLEKTIQYQIVIKPYFWQTGWFLSLCIFMAIGVVMFATWHVFNLQQKKKAIKAELERRMAEIENKAFLNQLNPHFLYNALNTLQDYIIQKDTHNGIVYLQRIASLHRNILEFNQKDLITVADEKAFLEKYLFIQQKRYSDKFSFEISLDEEVRHLKLPSMLLQPLVENAIEHGFANSDEANHVSVNFVKDKLLKIIIADNGNGDLKNLTQLKDGHALYMIKERLDFINQKKNTNQNTMHFNANNPKGIIITITIDL